jgi:hypothetical protein
MSPHKTPLTHTSKGFHESLFADIHDRGGVWGARDKSMVLAVDSQKKKSDEPGETNKTKRAL